MMSQNCLNQLNGSFSINATGRQKCDAIVALIAKCDQVIERVIRFCAVDSLPINMVNMKSFSLPTQLAGKIVTVKNLAGFLTIKFSTNSPAFRLFSAFRTSQHTRSITQRPTVSTDTSLPSLLSDMLTYGMLLLILVHATVITFLTHGFAPVAFAFSVSWRMFTTANTQISSPTFSTNLAQSHCPRRITQSLWHSILHWFYTTPKGYKCQNYGGV